METVVCNTTQVRVVPQYYDESLGWEGFCGGPDPDTRWIFKNDLLDLLSVLGFDCVETSFELPDHPNGPAFSLLAQKTDGNCLS